MSFLIHGPTSLPPTFPQSDSPAPSPSYLILSKPCNTRMDDETNIGSVRRNLTLQDLIVKLYYSDIEREEGDRTYSQMFKWVHQLDSATSGVVLVALNRDSARFFSAKFEDRCVSKTYRAIVRSEGDGWFEKMWECLHPPTDADNEPALSPPTASKVPLLAKLVWMKPPAPQLTPPVVEFDRWRRGLPADKSTLTPDDQELCQLKWSVAKKRAGVVARFTPEPPPRVVGPVGGFEIGVSSEVEGGKAGCDFYISLPVSDVKTTFVCAIPKECQPEWYKSTDETVRPRENFSGCLTGIKLLKRGEHAGKPAYLVEYHPHTGRRHQLRLHSLGLGGVILGDEAYGGTEFPRMCLHSRKLRVGEGERKGKRREVLGWDDGIENEWEVAEDFGISEEGKVWYEKG